MFALVSGSPALAGQTFNVTGAKFNDGSAVTGTFQTDDTFTTVTSFNITVQAGTGNAYMNGGFLSIPVAGTTYSLAAGATDRIFAGGISFTQPGIFGSRTLGLYFKAPLSASGATLTGGYEDQLATERTLAAGGTIDPAAAISAVPEPAAWAMMILGMGAVGFALRRQKVSMQVSYAA